MRSNLWITGHYYHHAFYRIIVDANSSQSKDAVPNTLSKSYLNWYRYIGAPQKLGVDFVSMSCYAPEYSSPDKVVSTVDDHVDRWGVNERYSLNLFDCSSKIYLL